MGQKSNKKTSLGPRRENAWLRAHCYTRGFTNTRQRLKREQTEPSEKDRRLPSHYRPLGGIGVGVDLNLDLESWGQEEKKT